MRRASRPKPIALLGQSDLPIAHTGDWRRERRKKLLAKRLIPRMMPNTSS